MNVTLLAPHQDDEILGAYLYLTKLRQHQHHISIVFATNGDYAGADVARRRYNESLNALSTCGIFENDIYYLGYADTGMQLHHSFLYRLYYSKAESECPSPYSRFTYHPSGKTTVHKLLFQKESIYNRQNFIFDLKHILMYLKPNMIIMPSKYDMHGDHMALSLFVEEVIKNHTTTACYTYLIHGGDDKTWPLRGNDSWSRPCSFPLKQWDNRVVITGSSSGVLKKKMAIQKFESQLADDTNNFLISFCKKEEIFFPLNLS